MGPWFLVGSGFLHGFYLIASLKLVLVTWTDESGDVLV